MADTNIKNHRTETSAHETKKSSEVLAQDVFNDMVKAAKLGDSANSKPALDAAKILSGLVKNSSERAAVFTTLSVDVNNSEVMKEIRFERQG